MKIVRLNRHTESAANAGLATTAPDSISLTEKASFKLERLLTPSRPRPT